MRRGEYRGGEVWWKVTLCLVLIASVGTGVYIITSRLDDDTLNVLVGVLMTLLGMIVIGSLFIGKDVVQAYLMRRYHQEDNISDMQQMALISKLLKGQNVKIPIYPARPMPDLIESGRRREPVDYRDTLFEEDEELTYE